MHLRVLKIGICKVKHVHSQGPKLRTYGSSVDIEGVVISAEICVSAMHFFLNRS